MTIFYLIGFLEVAGWRWRWEVSVDGGGDGFGEVANWLFLGVSPGDGGRLTGNCLELLIRSI